MNSIRVCDDPAAVAPLLNLLSMCVLIYAGVTRGGLLVAKALERLTRG